MPTLIPAIDLKNGQCVRLRKGKIDQATIFNDDPTAQAKIFERQGFSRLHVVDLDGAFSGKGKNSKAIELILANIDRGVHVQVGGGIRTLKDVESWIKKGVKRVILGTAAVKNPKLVKEACKEFPKKIILGIDAKDGKVAIKGWVEDADLSVIELAKRYEDIGVSAIIYTDIQRDGILTGLNFRSTLEFAQAVNIPIIASGGLSSIDDVKKLMKPEYAMLEGAIVGRALYNGSLDVQQAISLMRKV